MSAVSLKWSNVQVHGELHYFFKSASERAEKTTNLQ